MRLMWRQVGERDSFSKRQREGKHVRALEMKTHAARSSRSVNLTSVPPKCGILLAWTCLVAVASAAPKQLGQPASLASERQSGPMRHYDIWNMDANDVVDRDDQDSEEDAYAVVSHSLQENRSDNMTKPAGNRKSKVIHLFPVPVDGECLSDDGRRTGTCFNAYECRMKGGTSKGECAMGFGVCCIFIANCNETISNNITYLVSPNFPSFMPNNVSACTLKVKLLNDDISQLRIDFFHFSLGQPNRRTGRCERDGDVFNVSGGPGGEFLLCGQNSGQHIYYDLGGRSLPRQTLYGSLRPITLDQLYPNRNNLSQAAPIEIRMSFSQRFLPIRLWDIRIVQIPFSQRAPAGCLQYHTGSEGVIQTFNFAENGRHLANQHYRICMRQESEMCSIMYQPCDQQSFRIGPNRGMAAMGTMGSMGSMGGMGGMGGMVGMGGMGAAMSPQPGVTLSTVAAMGTGTAANTGAGTGAPLVTRPMPSSVTPAGASTAAQMISMANAMTTPQMMSSASAAATTAASSTAATTVAPTSPAATAMSSSTMPQRSSVATSTSPPPMSSASPTMSSAAPSSTTAATASSPLNDELEGSGGGDAVTPSVIGASRRPRPVSGGFDLLSFLRSAFDFGAQRQRRQRQFFSTCSDRITMPCIVEDFIGTGLGPLPGCEPVHCGSQFCSSGTWPCRIESTVTPFYIGVHFGDGAEKGSPEDNIGACLRYTQVQCM